MDLNIALYELLPDGDYVQLFDPAYELRASYVHDRVNRPLLRAGERQQLAFKSDRLTSRKFEVGSRLVVVLGVNKRPDRQINYGTGGPVNEESLDDGRMPVKIRWYSDSYIELPIRKAASDKEQHRKRLPRRRRVQQLRPPRRAARQARLRLPGTSPCSSQNTPRHRKKVPRQPRRSRGKMALERRPCRRQRTPPRRVGRSHQKPSPRRCRHHRPTRARRQVGRSRRRPRQKQRCHRPRRPKRAIHRVRRNRRRTRVATPLRRNLRRTRVATPLRRNRRRTPRVIPRRRRNRTNSCWVSGLTFGRPRPFSRPLETGTRCAARQW